MPSCLRILHLRGTPVWNSFEDDPSRFPDGGKIKRFLERKGVVFAEDDSVTVQSDGSVIVTSVTDPEPAWQQFANEDDPEVAKVKLRLIQIMSLRGKLIEGKATPADRDALLKLLSLMVLRLYAHEEE